MRIAVTGAGGFIGRHVVRALSAGGHELTASDRPGIEVEELPAGVRWRAADLLDPAAVHALVEGHDAAVHCAGLFDLGAERAALTAANVTAVERVVEACRAAGVKRLVHLGTTGVYGRPRVVPCDERQPPRPRHAYEETKALGELVARGAMRDLRVTVLRPTLVYGPYGRYGLCMYIGALVLAQAAGRMQIPGLVRTHRLSAVHVEDVARAVAFVVDEPSTDGEIYNLADATPMATGDALELIAARFGMRIEPRIDIPRGMQRAVFSIASRLLSDRRLALMDRRTTKAWRRLAERLEFQPAFIPRLDRDWFSYASADHVYDGAKLRALGYEYRYPDFAQGFGQTVDWYFEHGWLPDPDRLRAWGAERRARALKRRQKGN